MNRIVRGVVAIMMGASLGAISASPAPAHTEVCVGPGVGTTWDPLFFSGTGPRASTFIGISMSTSSTLCLPSLGGVALAASIAGWCDQFNGTGQINGHQVDLTSAGTLLVAFSTVASPPLGRAVVGIAHVVPDVTATPVPQSCLTAGAKQFLVTGAFVMI